MSWFERWRGKSDKPRTSRQISGAAAEEAALRFLCSQGLQEVQRNFRCRGGEIDLIMQQHDTLVFVEPWPASRRPSNDA